MYGNEAAPLRILPLRSPLAHAAEHQARTLQSLICISILEFSRRQDVLYIPLRISYCSAMKTEIKSSGIRTIVRGLRRALFSSDPNSIREQDGRAFGLRSSRAR